MPTARTRTVTFGEQTGYLIHLPSGVATERSVSLGSARCADIIGNFPYPNPLEIITTSLKPGIVSGQPLAFPTYRMEKYPYDNQPGAFPGTGWDDDMPSLTESVTKIAAGKSINRATVSLPILIRDLRELPDALHLKGLLHKQLHPNRRQKAFWEDPIRFRSIPAYAGGAWLAWHFGWEQLYRDVSHIFQFMADVDARIKQYKAAYSKRGYRTNGRVWSNTVSSSVLDEDVQTFNATVRVRRSFETKAERWASVVWRPTQPPPFIPSDPELLSKARSAVHGWRGSPADVWEVLPWSWMVDYFINIGDVLETFTGGCEFSAGEGCVMTKVRSVTVDTVTHVSDGFTATGGIATHELKLRELATPGFAIKAPFLSPTRLANIASIIATRL